MRRIITTTEESHPDTPAGDYGNVQPGRDYVWMVYIEGRPFAGVPWPEANSHGKAREWAEKIVATGRYEYVDVRLVEDRRIGCERRDLDTPKRYPTGQRATDGPSRAGWYTPHDRRNLVKVVAP